MHVIVLASQKGGAGKTTLAAHIAIAAEAGGDGPAVLIDADPQGSLSAWWNVREAQVPALAPSHDRRIAGQACGACRGRLRGRGRGHAARHYRGDHRRGANWPTWW